MASIKIIDTDKDGTPSEALAPPASEKREEEGGRRNGRVHHAENQLLMVPLKDIVLPEKNVRTGELPDISGLAKSIERDGILEPLLVTPTEDGKYRLMAGNRRYFAAKVVGLKTVPAHVMSADDKRSHRVALVENLHREGMTPMDTARGIQELIELEGCEQKDAATILGVSPGYVSQHLALLKLPAPVQKQVERGNIDLTTARTLGRLKDEEKMVELARVAPEMSGAELAQKVDHLVAKEKEQKAKEVEEERPKKSAKTGGAPREHKSLSERYAEMELAPLKKTDLKDTLMYYADKLDRAESETKRAEYKWMLKGLEIAAGLK